MKSIILLVLVLILVGCTKPREQQVNERMEEYWKGKGRTRIESAIVKVYQEANPPNPKKNQDGEKN